MSDDIDLEKNENTGVVEFVARPKKVKQTHTFLWQLQPGVDYRGTRGALLSVVFSNFDEGLWKPGDCVKITMEKVDE